MSRNYILIKKYGFKSYKSHLRNMIFELSDHLINRWFFFFIGELSIMNKYISKIKNILLWIFFVPLSFIAAVLGGKLFFLFSDTVFNSYGGVFYPFVKGFGSVIVGCIIFSGVSFYLIPSKNKTKCLTTFVVLCLWAIPAFFLNLYFIIFQFNQATSVSVYTWGVTLAISLIAIVLLYLIFSPQGIREILQEFSEEQKND